MVYGDRKLNVQGKYKRNSHRKWKVLFGGLESVGLSVSASWLYDRPALRTARRLGKSVGAATRVAEDCLGFRV